MSETPPSTRQTQRRGGPTTKTGDPVGRPEEASKLQMTEKPDGKHSTDPTMGNNAMENDGLPKFVIDQAYTMVNQSITTATMRKL